MNKHAELIAAMVEYEKGVPHRIQHFLKVYGFAKTIGELENLDNDSRFVLETAAIVHDIGIKPALVKNGSSAGKYQEELGGSPARNLLGGLGFDETVIDRVVFLVEHHHTYTGVDDLDWQILLEADFLVNMLEEEMTAETIKSAYDKVFKTKTGRRLCEEMYLLTAAD